MSSACTGVGIAAGTRIAIGQAYLICAGQVCITPRWIGNDQIDSEVLRFQQAVSRAASELHAIRDEIPHDTPSEIAEFIDTHLLMLEDRALSVLPIQLIRHDGMSAEWALQQHRDALIRVFDSMDDPYLRTRKDDLDDVINRIQRILLEREVTTPDDLRGRIVLANELSPAEVVQLKNRGAVGFICESGGPMSHTAILARSLDIPALVGARSATRFLRHGEMLVLDAANGVAIAACSQATLNDYRARLNRDRVQQNSLYSQRERPATSLDGQDVLLMANIELAGDVHAALRNGAAGIGLYRTEFLYMNRTDLPDEDEHFAAYRAVVEGMGGRPVTIRTLDLGADKQPAITLGTGGCNPALGLRAIRLCLKEPELFYPQLRAILRVSALGPVRLMLPMLTSLWEVGQARKMIVQAMHDLTARGEAFDPNIPIGGMIEVPAAALVARSFAAQLDFLSIGTNDLIQYTLAIDRVDDEVNHLYDPAHPAVLELIRGTLRAAQAAGIPISMCGEMASDPLFVPLLLGLGLRELSMQPSALLTVKQQLATLDIARLQPASERLFEQLGSEVPQTLLARLVH